MAIAFKNKRSESFLSLSCYEIFLCALLDLRLLIRVWWAWPETKRGNGKCGGGSTFRGGEHSVHSFSRSGSLISSDAVQTRTNICVSQLDTTIDSCKMSLATFTTTEPPAHLEPTSLENTLRDYALCYSTTAEPQTFESNLEVVPLVPQRSDNPANWPTRYRRIPPYRPVNRNLDLSERPNGSNRGELVFVTVMMNGVRLQSVSCEEQNLTLC